MMFGRFFEKFLADFLMVYKILPVRLKRATLFVLACVGLQAILEVIAILSISFLAVSVTAPERLRQIGPILTMFQMFPRLEALCEDPRYFALLASSAAVSVVAAKNAMFAYVSHATARLGEGIALFAGETIFYNYLCSPYITHLSGESGRMFQAMAWRSQLASMITLLLSVYTYMVITIALLLTILLFIPGVVLAIILAVGMAAIGVYKSLKGSMDRAGQAAAEGNREEGRVTINAMSGIRETLIYRQQAVFFDKFREACLSGMKDRIFLQIAPPIPTWVLETVGFCIIPATLWIMFAYQDASMARITAVLTLIMLISWRLLPLLNRSLGALVAVRGVRHAALDCLSLIEEAKASPAPEPLEPDPDFVLRRSIALDSVNFRYPKAENDCLHGLTFTIPRSAKVGIIGQSGAGKSSIAAILSGLVEPTQGQMLVDGKNLNPSELAAYRQQVGYVPQNPYIMGGTVAENVAFSQWGKPWDEERVMRVCLMAEFDVAVQRGIDAPLGQNGIGLSGGQAQRLSIARALYANPSILIFDEATSALDSGVEKAIMNTIFGLPKGITTITIAHRLTTVERCDSLIWIEGGTIKMTGSPEEVLPAYQEFLEQKASESLLDHCS